MASENEESRLEEEREKVDHCSEEGKKHTFPSLRVEPMRGGTEEAAVGMGCWTRVAKDLWGKGLALTGGQGCRAAVVRSGRVRVRIERPGVLSSLEAESNGCRIVVIESKQGG